MKNSKGREKSDQKILEEFLDTFSDPVKAHKSGFEAGKLAMIGYREKLLAKAYEYIRDENACKQPVELHRLYTKWINEYKKVSK